MQRKIQFIKIALLSAVCSAVQADYKDDIGYTRLLSEQGVNTPDGDGVLFAQVEAYTGNPLSYMPNVNDAEFSNHTIVDRTGFNPGGIYANHANSVGKLFYGASTSIAPAGTTVHVYNTDWWLGENFLRFGSGQQPYISPERVANHSWIGNYPGNSYDLEIVKRLDWAIDTDEFIQVTGITNSITTNAPLLSASFNAISVGTSDGVHGRGSASIGGPYVSGRTRPDLVAPFSVSSSATPVVTAAAVILTGLGHNDPTLSTDALAKNKRIRSGDKVYNAERSEVIKAVLMAGADRVTLNSTNPDPATPQDITDYRAIPANRSTNGLDIRFGAGQLNIYNSFHILSAGEQNSQEDKISTGGAIAAHGFDYDPIFGGNPTFGGMSSNTTGSYYFSTGTGPVMLAATLTWNIHINVGGAYSFPGNATLRDLDLRLYDETGGGHTLVAESVSTIENSENLYLYLDPGKDYLMEVIPKAGQATFNWDYALAWSMQADTDADTIPDNIDTDDDNDELSDAIEDGLGTNPLLADTDSDGFDDSMEVAYGSNPLLDSDTPTGNYINNGDINNDGSVGVEDVLLVNRILLKELTPTAAQEVSADMVPDNRIDASDLLKIQRAAVGL